MFQLIAAAGESASVPEETASNPEAADEDTLPNEFVDQLTIPWTGDFDGMVERRLIRALVVPSKTFYFVDRGQQRGLTYEALKKFEDIINEQLKTRHLKVFVAIIPVARDELLPALVEGRGDIAAANLTITPERQQQVAFSDPLLTGVDEIIVTGPAAPALKGLDDLAGQEIWVRPSSSYHESLTRLNEALAKAGKAAINLRPASEYLEDEDLLEMVNAGLIPMIVVDSHKAEFWGQIFDNIVLHQDLAVNSGGEIAWAFRKNSPSLQKVINDFVKDHKKGTLFGNIVFKRYLRNTEYVKNALSDKELEKFRQTVEFFRRYAGEYGFDWLMVAAQGYQESKLDQSTRSSAGAIGVMQLLPTTAADPNVGIHDIHKLDNNIHAGVKYLRFILDRYFADADMDSLNKTLFAFASYNAGPARIAGLRKKAAKRGLDPNRWFRHVEVVAAEDIGQETVQYVSNIYKYYVAYRLIVEKMELQEKQKAKLQSRHRQGQNSVLSYQSYQ